MVYFNPEIIQSMADLSAERQRNFRELLLHPCAQLVAQPQLTDGGEVPQLRRSGQELRALLRIFLRANAPEPAHAQAVLGRQRNFRELLEAAGDGDLDAACQLGQHY